MLYSLIKINPVFMSQSATFLYFPQRLNYYFQQFFLMITLSIESKSSLKIQFSEFKKCLNFFLNIIIIFFNNDIL